MSDQLTALERLLRRDRQVVGAALILVAVLAWIYTLAGAGMGANAFAMSALPWSGAREMPMSMPISGMSYGLGLLAMWMVMMIAMMLPSAAPTILLAAALNRRSSADRPPYGTAGLFAIGYLLAWFLFSVAATLAQLGMARNGLMSAMMNSNSSAVNAGLFIAAGVWQFSPVKQACLRHCRSPVDFITRHRRPGNRGALLMGLHHGAYCLGCCWFLMALLFAGGVMNLYWIAGIALFVLVEKRFSAGAGFGYLAGAGFIVSGTALLVL